jgi:uncharacterized protein
MRSKVYFTNLKTTRGQSLLAKLEKLVNRAEILNSIKPQDLVAMKCHFGEKGNLAYIRPQYIRQLVDQVKDRGGKPFLTDTSTLYAGHRDNAVKHLETAIGNGFDYAVVGAPLVIADGLNGKEFVNVSVDFKHFKEVKIASSIYHADALVVVSHFKGASLHGFGGALKNLGMGLASKYGKLQQHSDVLPQVNQETCKRCNKCIKWCPVNAIVIEEKARIIEADCIGCGECTITCPHKAIEINWKTDLTAIQEKTVEYAAGGIKGREGEVGFITFVTNVSPLCDCFGWNDVPLVGDIGILASKDPVAIDQAAFDLVNQSLGNPNSELGDKFRELNKFNIIYPAVDATIQLAYAEKIGMGNRKYDLVDLN